MSTSSGTISVIVNASPDQRRYRYHDQHVDDTQADVSFAMLRNGWHAQYLFAQDAYRVQSPSGLLRTYVRV